MTVGWVEDMVRTGRGERLAKLSPFSICNSGERLLQNSVG